MALTYRSPLEEVVGCFEPSVQSAIANVAANGYKDLEEENFSLFNYALGPLAKERLSKAGIYLSPFSAVPHSHPVCKTLENYMLYKVLPSYIDNKFVFVGIKAFKLNILKVRSGKKAGGAGNLDLVQHINRYVTSADKLRYGNEFVITKSLEHKFLKRHAVSLEAATLRDLVPECLKLRSKYLFMHDELHYWDTSTLSCFLEVIDPEVLIGTLVYPAELLMGSKESLHKWCYTYEVKGGDLLFYPDGVRSEGYVQPLHCGYLLKAKSLVLPNGVCYGIDIIASKFSHHLVAITKGKGVSCQYRSFGPFDAVSSVGLNRVSRNVGKCFPISFEVVSRIYRYLRTLKKPDLQSAMAKLGQLLPEPSGTEIKFLEEFAKLVIQTSTLNVHINADLVQGFMGRFLGCGPSFISSLFASVKSISLDEFVGALEPYCFTMQTTELRFDHDEVVELKTFGEAEEDVDLVRCLDSFRVGSVIQARRPAMYFMPNCGKMRGSLVQIQNDQIVRFLVKLLHKSRNDFYQCGISSSDLIAYVLALSKKQTLVDLKVLLKDHEAMRRVRVLVRELGVQFVKRYEPKRIEQAGCTEPMPYSLKSVYSQVVLELLNSKSVVPVVSVGQTKQKSGPEILVKPEEKSGPQSLKCSCGIAMPITCLPRASMIADFYPDALKGREAAWYSRNGVGYEYNGGSHSSNGWPEWIEAWAKVNGLDISGYNCLLAQRYKKGASLNLHADDEVCFERSKILTVNVEGEAEFKVLGRTGCAGKVELTSGQCFEMPDGFQESHKHGVFNCSGGRVSFTFRLLKVNAPVMESATLIEPTNEVEGSQEQPGVLAYEYMGVSVESQHCRLEQQDFINTRVDGDGNCFWYSLETVVGLSMEAMKKLVATRSVGDVVQRGRLADQLSPGVMAQEEAICGAADALKLRITIFDHEQQAVFVFTPKIARSSINLLLAGEHFEPVRPANDCVLRCMAEVLKRDVAEVLRVLEENFEMEDLLPLWNAGGLEFEALPAVFELFGVKASLLIGGELTEINSEGEVEATFELSDGHLSVLPVRKEPSAAVLNRHVGKGAVSESSVVAFGSHGTKLKYKPLMSRAARLSKSLLVGQTGVISSKLFNGKEDLLNGGWSLTESERDVYAILGTFGAGKSTLFRKFMAANKTKNVIYVSPRRGLADDFARLVGMHDQRKSRGKDRASKNWRVHTFETFLCKARTVGPGSAVIIDEIQLYPPGYLDLACLCLPEGVAVFLVGDPCQSDYDNEKDRGVFYKEMSDIDLLLQDSEYRYNCQTRRFRNGNFQGRLPCDFDCKDLEVTEGHMLVDGLELVDELEEVWKEVVLVSSFEEKKIVQSYFMSDVLALTFGESTGRTFGSGCILITEASKFTNEKRWLTALSRFSKNVCFVNATGSSFSSLMSAYKGRCLYKFITKTAGKDDLLDLLPGKPIFSLGFETTIGKDEGVKEEKLAGDPWLKGMIDLLQLEDVEEAQEDMEEMQSEWFKTHLPQCELESVRARWVHKILAKEHREVRIGNIVSEQFTDEHSKERGLQLTNAAERFETIYPRHRASDTVTFLMAVKKRLRFSNPNKERAKLHEARNYGRFLLNEFLQKVPLRRNLNKDLMARAKMDFEDKKTSKSAATIENHSGRSCRDWLADVGLIFSKSQICTKFDNRFRSAKAAQTIVCFAHSVLCRFAPYMRYIEYKLKEVLPARFYIHSGKGLDELNDWVKVARFEGICTESDYEAFDASQDQYIVAFEIEVMKWLGLPVDLIEDYVYIKTHLGSKLGSFAIMRFSGEASTFLFNTMANMLFTFLRYDLKGNEMICFAGDDMCANAKLKISREHESFLDKLKLKAKVEMKDTPTFCGWNLCSDGIFKKPQLVLERMCIAKETNNLHNCIDNYAIEVSYAYLLGERAINRMSEEELEAHYNCVRIIIKKKHLLKSSVVNVFRDNLD